MGQNLGRRGKCPPPPSCSAWPVIYYIYFTAKVCAGAKARGPKLITLLCDLCQKPKEICRNSLFPTLILPPESGDSKKRTARKTENLNYYLKRPLQYVVPSFKNFWDNLKRNIVLKTRKKLANNQWLEKTGDLICPEPQRNALSIQQKNRVVHPPNRLMTFQSNLIWVSAGFGTGSQLFFLQVLSFHISWVLFCG